MPGGRIISPDNPLGPDSPGAGMAGAFPGYGVVHDVVGGVKDVLGGAKDVGAALVFLTNPQNWLRVGEAIAGGVLILVGIMVLVWHSPAGEAIRTEAPAAAKVAAIV